MLQRRTPMKQSGSLRRTGMRQIAPARVAREDRVLPKYRVERGVPAVIDDKVRAVPKQPREENAHLLEMARGKPCLFWFVAGCRRDFDPGEHCTTVKAHDNRLTAGKGKGYKAHDWCSVDACDPCHRAYDQGKAHTREEKNTAFDAALQRQLADWRRIAGDAHEAAKDRAAAQWAIDRYEHHQRLQGDQS